MQNRTFCCFLGRFFGEKLKTAPPKGNWVPKSWSRCRDSVWKSVWNSDFSRKIRHNFVEDLFFFFGDHLILGWKIVWISDSGRKIRLNFGRDLFFFIFLETTWFWAEKSFEFPILDENSDTISVKIFFFFLETTCFWAEKSFEYWILRQKSDSISVKTFFFLEITCFWAEKTFELQSFPRNSVSIFGQTVWNWFKNNKNSGQGRLHFSHSFKKAPPLFQILATRLVTLLNFSNLT